MNPTIIPSMQLASIAINFENHYFTQGKVILSVVLEDLVSGYKINIVQDDPKTLDWWNLHSLDWQTTVFNKLTADGALPPGTVQ